MPASRYGIVFAPEAIDHLREIERKYHGLIEQTIRERLSFAPEKVSRNRKLFGHPAPGRATWELRFGPSNRFRVFYEVHPAEKEVWILAVGVKERNRLLIGREEFPT